MISYPNAKINIGLRILEKRPDGFHNIESCFYPIPWCDILEITPSDQLSFSSFGIDIPGSADTNLCIKAFKLLQHDFDIAPVQINLQKIIPIGAGMGGGSSDAAFTLKMLNDFYKLNLSTSTLESYAKKLGSDCAFFIQNKPVIAIEKGDVFKPTTLNLTGKQIVAIYPETHISTQEAYSGVSPQLHGESLEILFSQDIKSWQNVVSNDFEASIFPNHPSIENLKDSLLAHGASYSSMTGSGSTVFGIFETPLDDLSFIPDSFTYKVMILN